MPVDELTAKPDGWFCGRHVTVMGLGRFGGGLGVVQWLHSLGARILVTDLAAPETLRPSLEPIADAIADGSITLRLGSHDRRDFEAAELVIANAAVPRPWACSYLCAARAARVPVTTEIRLSIERLGSKRIVGITGSAGKSTTTAMTVAALQASGRDARVGGNIGGSLLGRPVGSAHQWTVLELSSAQLWWLSNESGGAGWSPTVAALTNIAPNHVDWHENLAHYIQFKGQIRRNQLSSDRFISYFAQEDPAESLRMASALGAEAWWLGGSQPSVPDADEIELMLPGAHQRKNARMALAITALCAEIDGNPVQLDAAQSALRSFAGLDHRLQPLGTVRGVRCFNDSKATTPEATLLAVGSFPDPSRIHLIVGGYDKKVDLSAIRDLAPRLAGLYAIGTTAPMLAPHPPAMRCAGLAEAVEQAFSRAKEGDLLLLSPACSSLDQFLNFQERGDLFTRLVRDRAPTVHC